MPGSGTTFSSRLIATGPPPKVIVTERATGSVLAATDSQPAAGDRSRTARPSPRSSTTSIRRSLGKASSAAASPATSVLPASSGETACGRSSAGCGATATVTSFGRLRGTCFGPLPVSIVSRAAVGSGTASVQAEGNRDSAGMPGAL